MVAKVAFWFPTIIIIQPECIKSIKKEIKWSREPQKLYTTEVNSIHYTELLSNKYWEGCSNLWYRHDIVVTIQKKENRR